jgi:hypothetical protein
MRRLKEVLGLSLLVGYRQVDPTSGSLFGPQRCAHDGGHTGEAHGFAAEENGQPRHLSLPGPG